MKPTPGFEPGTLHYEIAAGDFGLPRFSALCLQMTTSALGLISLPFIWTFRLIRGTRANGGTIAGSDDSVGSESEEADDSSSAPAGAELTEPG